MLVLNQEVPERVKVVLESTEINIFCDSLVCALDDATEKDKPRMLDMLDNFRAHITDDLIYMAASQALRIDLTGRPTRP